MGQLFANIQTKEDDARAKIERSNEAFKIEAALAGSKKLMEQFATLFSKVDIDFSEILLTKVAAATSEEQKEDKNCLKEM